MSDEPPAVEKWPRVKVMFADGTYVWARSGSASDHILNRVVLKYVTICVLVYSLLGARADVQLMDAWQMVTLWMIGFTSVIWLYLAASVALVLIRSGIILFVFTPFISVPLVFVTETVTQLTISNSIGQPIASFASIVHHLVRDVIILILFDIQYGSYVAPRHPMYRLASVFDEIDVDRTDAEAAAPPVTAEKPKRNAAADLTEMRKAASTDAKQHVETTASALSGAGSTIIKDVSGSVSRPRASEDGTLTISGEVLRLSELYALHAEDHYVRVLAGERRLLLRGRFSEIVEMLGPELGVQITRSDWLSRMNILSIQRTNDYKLLVFTRDHQTLTVARARKADVTTFARINNIPVTRPK